MTKFLITERNQRRLEEDPKGFIFGAFHLYKDCYALTQNKHSSTLVIEGIEKAFEYRPRVNIENEPRGWVCRSCDKRRTPTETPQKP